MNRIRNNASVSEAGAAATQRQITKIARRPELSFTGGAQFEMTNKPDHMPEAEYLRYLATCEQSYDIMKQTFALYTLHPNALYAI